jgi:hypothetical protein
MKWLVFLFIPLFSFSQVTYKDLLSLNSVDQFKRVMIENNYQSVENEEETLTYGIYPTKNDEGEMVAYDWAFFFPEHNGFMFSFTQSLFGGKFTYNVIYDIVKEKCKFSKIYTLKVDDDKPTDYACYTCPESSVGLIGFTKQGNEGNIINTRE